MHSSAVIAMCSSIKRRTRSSTLIFGGSTGPLDGAALALKLLALMLARMAGRSFQLSSCLASSLLSFLRALMALHAASVSAHRPWAEAKSSATPYIVRSRHTDTSEGNQPVRRS
jgi:hypothetical protein